jgi:pimeloyl-ACP methyl ester carboxylesterase
MSTSTITANRTNVEVYREGAGSPVLYLHGIYDMHTLQAEPFPFHRALSKRFELIAPAHPGCGESGGMGDVIAIEDLAFHYFDVLDALGRQQVDVVGFCLGGWIAAEIAVRNPERVGRLVLIDAPGLRVPGELIGDIFMMALPREGTVLRDLRELLFIDPDGELANAIVPDGRVSVEDEVRRYKSLTLTGRVGWEPAYLHNPKLLGRLHRIRSSTLVIWGQHDQLVPLSHGRAYAAAIPGAQLQVLPASGHSPILEQPEECAELVASFLGEHPQTDNSEAWAAGATR